MRLDWKLRGVYQNGHNYLLVRPICENNITFDRAFKGAHFHVSQYLYHIRILWRKTRLKLRNFLSVANFETNHCFQHCSSNWSKYIILIYQNVANLMLNIIVLCHLCVKCVKNGQKCNLRKLLKNKFFNKCFIRILTASNAF